MLEVLVDYDNVDKTYKSSGPVNLAKILLALVDSSVLASYTRANVRLYGGWREQFLTRAAQRLIPDIGASSPCVFGFTHGGVSMNLRLTVELADRPLRGLSPLGQTLARDRELRQFRTRPLPWAGCANHGSCGLASWDSVSYGSICGNAGCSVKIGDILVRDEQKMVDTLIVADIAHQVFVAKAKDIVVVSSDTDMWPGILLALDAGCRVFHVHTKHGSSTQPHLLNTISRALLPAYHQKSV